MQTEFGEIKMPEENLFRKNRIYRNREHRLIAGVCGGIAEHFDFPVWAVRVAVVALALFVPWTLLIYIVLAFLLKQAPEKQFRNYEEEEFYNIYQQSRPAALRKIHRQFQMLDNRLQRMESMVTSPEFELEKQYRNL